jgi:hypothetical protein
MTLPTEQKRHFLRRFKGCYQHTYPKGVTVHVTDCTQFLKTKGADITTVQEYLEKHVRRHVREVLEDTNKTVLHQYCLLDRGGNLAKKLFTGHKRNRVPPAEEREDGKLNIPSDGLLPVNWDNLVANRAIADREIKPLYYRALIQEYEPPPGKFLILDSAPTQPLTEEEARVMGEDAYNKVWGVRTAPQQLGAVQMSSRDILNTPVGPAKPQTERFQCPPHLYTHRIQEADLAAFFHVNKHIPHPGAPPGTAPDPIICIDGNDFDYVWVALLQCGDRIDKRTSRFNSRVWIKLKGQAAAREAHKRRKTKAQTDREEAAKKREAAGEDPIEDDAGDEEEDDNPIDGRDIYININKAYLMMQADEDLKHAQYPVGMAVLLYILGGTDFFDDFMGDDNSIFHGMGWEANVWDTWCAHKNRFANLIMLFYTGPAGYNQPDLCRRPYLDEDAMLTFFHQCYATKYGKAVRDIFDVDQVTPTQLREYTRGFAVKCKRKPNETDDKWQKRWLMTRKKAMPEDPILRRYARLALLNWSYWLNGYRPGGDAFCDPLELYEGLPYYGYLQDPGAPNRFTLSPIVSPAKPVPETVLPYMGLHTAQARAAAQEARLIAQEEMAKEDEEAKSMAREQERLERQRKLVEKEKRLAAQEKKKALPQGHVFKRAPAPLPSVHKVVSGTPAAVVQSRITHTAQLAPVGRGAKRAPPPLQRE